MNVETFETTVEKHPEACEEAKRIIEEMGLAGQQSTVGETGARLPYRQLRADEHIVYRELLPCIEDVKAYQADSIPLRVLQVLAHAQTLGIFEGYRVWHAGNPAMKDPVLVGYMQKEAWNTEKHYILARWGDELEEFPILLRRAAEIRMARAKEEVRKIIARAQAALTGLDNATPNIHVSIPQYFD